MKIAILTHRLGENYGGIMQAFALQRIVRTYVHAERDQVQTVHLHPHQSWLRRFRAGLSGSYRNKTLYINSSIVDAKIFSQTRDFVANNIETSDSSALGLSDLVIVGSDQVWRAIYVDPVKYMLGNGVDDNVPRISYAASFGTDDLSEYTHEQVTQTKELAQKFMTISVREESGVAISRKYWDIDAVHHVDPTLLLNTADYNALIDAARTDKPKGTLFVYVLDRSDMNNLIIDKVQRLSGTTKFETMPKVYMSFINLLLNRKDHMMPKVEQWLRSFRDAEYVVTDSFHGTVFSIVFNKRFITIGNKKRGLARFSSLLRTFGLESRLISDVSEITDELVADSIDWNAVRVKIESEQKRSEVYIRKYLRQAKRRA